MDRWICNGQVYIANGEGFGIDDDLRTFRIGTEHDILEGTDARTIRNLNRAGAYGLLGLEQDTDGQYAGGWSPLPKDKPARQAVQRIKRRRLANRLRS